jgi:glutamate-1-semialdehyde 2,1-aminomutase
MIAMNFITLTAIALISLYLISRIFIRLQLSVAKHPSLKGHSKMSRRVAKLLPFFDYSKDTYFCTDGAPKNVSKKREMSFERLKGNIVKQSPITLAHSASLESSISDIQFTSQYRVPFPYRTLLPEEFKLGSVVEESKGTKIKDLDGNWRYDVSGSYGVNVFGYEFYKRCMDNAFDKVNTLGPVLGSYHPLIKNNVDAIKKISGLDEVSFHMSGTEAVMQAVRLARYHTNKTHLVRLCGAYHGWWDGVQPGVGNKRKVNDVYTLKDLSEKTLTVLKTRKDIACVLINPLQAFHPNSDTSSDVTLIASDRSTAFNKEAYTIWLKKIRKICSDKDIVLIFDEVFTGFRLSYRGAQGYFDVQADLVTYGKTLGGGLPVGVVAGKRKLMKRYKDNRPANVSFARGTFNSHPYVMATMNEFLQTIEQSEYQQKYTSQETIWNRRVAEFNQRLINEKLPIKIDNMHSILSVIFTQPSRYNWVLQFYLRDSGLELSWIGSGRMIMSFDYTDNEFNHVIDCFIVAAKAMENEGWWWSSDKLTNKNIKRQFLIDMLSAKIPVLKHWLTTPLIGTNGPKDINTLEKSDRLNNNHTKIKKAG